MPDTTAPVSLPRAMLASLRGYWLEANGYQKFLYLIGALLILSALFHAGVLVATGGALAGDVSWRKPILFGESFGLTAISLAWIATFLPRGRLLGYLLTALGVANFGEVLWVSVQQWRGVRSHFNPTPFDGALFDFAGILIAITGIVIVAVTLCGFISLRAPTSFAWAIRVGLLLLVAGQVFGFLIIRNDGPVFGAAGAMKVPHALSLHGPQVLPLLAWLLSFSDWSERRRTRTVVLASAGYTLLVVVGAYQTFTGRTPLDLSLGAGLLLLAGALAVAAAFVRALLALQQAPRAVASVAHRLETRN